MMCSAGGMMPSLVSIYSWRNLAKVLMVDREDLPEVHNELTAKYYVVEVRVVHH